MRQAVRDPCLLRSALASTLKCRCGKAGFGFIGAKGVPLGQRNAQEKPPKQAPTIPHYQDPFGAVVCFSPRGQPPGTDSPSGDSQLAGSQGRE